MSLAALLDELKHRGVRLEVAGERLRVSAPRGAVTPELRRALTEHKGELLVQLQQGGVHAAPSLERIPRDGPLPLSFAQERLWFLDRLGTGGVPYKIPVAFRVSGRLDHGAFQESLRHLCRRHEVLRGACRERGGRAEIHLVDEVEVPLPVEDRPEASPGELAAVLAEETRRPFDLAEVPILRARLLRLAPDEHVILLVTHHFVADGWSMRILVQELLAVYQALVRGQELSLPPLAVQYADFAAWQRRAVEGDALAADRAYWRRQLAPPPPPLALPFARPRPEARSGRGGVCPIQLGAEVWDGVRALARERRCTPFMTLTAAFAALLTRYDGGREVAIATAVSGRPRLELEPLLGCFVNNLVLRCDLSGDPSFVEALGRVREITVEAFAHQELPFEKLVEELNPQRDLGRTPLFQAMVVLENAPLGELDLAGLRLTPIPVDLGTSRFDLTLSLADGESQLAGSLEYDADLFVEADVRRLGAHLSTLLEGAVADPHRRLSRLPLLLAEERRRVVDLWNATAMDYEAPGTLHALVEAQVDRSPQAEAVAFEGRTLSYRELERRANQLAHRLLRLGIGPETVVGVAMERSLELVVALLAVLKAGAAYLPLDPDYPEERLATMLEDSGASLVLTQAWLAKAPPSAAGARVLATGGGWEEVAAEPAAPPAVSVEPLGCAYVIYTSGSTGRPKGVMVPHTAIVNRLLWMQETFGIGPGDRVAQKTPFSFDVSVWELFWPLTAGARLEMAPPGIHRDAAALGDWIEATQTTVIHFVPSMLRIFLDHGDVKRCDSLRLVVTSGEALTADLVERFRRRVAVELHNLYGPTEAAVDVTHWPCDERPEADPVPIGRAIANIRILILDEALEPTPVGVPGELCIGGVGLARGYLGRPGLTAQAFAPDPASGELGARLYRTGDLARWRDDGTVEFLGRHDTQVKVRGFRVELGEIEAVLGEHPEVSQAVVTAPEIAGDRRLAAYVVPPPGCRPTATALRRHLATKLPSHMVPGPVVLLDELPLTPSGKVDRRALPDPLAATEEEAVGVRMQPRTTTEQVLAGLWAELLGVDAVAADGDFFALGGHSLLATRLVARIREAFGVELPLRAVFEAPRLADLAREIDRREAGEELPPLERLAHRDELPLSAIQERLWFLDRFEPGSAALNMPLALRLRGSLDPAAVEAALQRVLARHEALRVTFGERDGRPVQRCHESSRIPLPMIDLAALPAAEAEAARARHLEEMASAPFDLATGPLVRGRLLRLADEEHLLLLTVHHIVADGWSLGLVVEDLVDCYRAHLAGREPELPPLAFQHADFAAWQRRRLDRGDLEGSLRYWRTTLDGAPEQLELPTDRRRPALQTFRGRRVGRSIPRGPRDALRRLARDQGATPFMALLAAFAVVLHRWSGQAGVVVGAPVAGRPHRELDRVVGPFLNTVALRLDLSEEPSFRQLLGRTWEVVLGALQQAELPFERVLDAVQPPREPSRTPLFQVFFNMLNFPTPRLELPGLELEVEAPPPPPSKFDLTVYIADEDDATRLEIVYNADLFDDERMEEMVEQLGLVVEQAGADPELAVSSHSLVTPRARRRLPDPTTRLDAAWPGPVHELFDRQAARRPEASAVEDSSGAHTYEQVAVAAGALAATLARHGVGAGDTVAVYAHRSAALVWSILGILQRGAAVALLDPAYPERRLAQYIELAKPRALLRLQAAGPLPGLLENLLERLGAPVIEVPAAPPRGAVEALSGGETGPDEPACIAFTSGSTGEPKAVVGAHRSLTHFLPWQQELFELSAEDRYTVLSGLGHDPLQRDLFTPLTTGATVCIPDSDAMGTPGLLAEWAARSRVSVAHLTPAMARLLSEVPAERPIAIPSLRWVFLVGEALTRAIVRRLREIAPRVRCVNLYGATETQRAVAYELVDATASREGEGGSAVLKETVPLGRGAPDVQLLLLAGAGQLAGVGEVGEIHVRSPHLARGYLGPTELTAERFRENPFTEIGRAHV